MTPRTAPGRSGSEVALRDPLTPQRKRATSFMPEGTFGTSRFVDAEGRPQVLAIGDLEAVSGFGPS